MTGGNTKALFKLCTNIFVGTLGHSFFALNTSTGDAVWANNTSTPGTSGEPSCSGEVWSSLGSLGVEDSVYFGVGGTADVSTNCSATLHRLDKVREEKRELKECGVLLWCYVMRGVFVWYVV